MVIFHLGFKKINGERHTFGTLFSQHLVQFHTQNYEYTVIF